MRHEDDARRLIDKIVAHFGRLDIAINNAGTEGTPGPVTEQSAASYAAIFETNVLGTLLSLKHELRVMLPQRHGSIINVSVRLWPNRYPRRLSLRGQQACGRRADEIGCTRGSGIRGAR